MLFRSALLGAALLLSGCFTFRSTILVRPDGSGTLTETLALLPQALALMGTSEAPLSSPEALAARAEVLGVRLVRSDTSGSARTTVYAFDDIRALRYSLPDNAQDGASATRQEPRFTFAFSPDSARRAAALQIRTAEPPPAPEVSPDSVQDAENGIAMARFLLGEARMTVEVVVDGEPVLSGADYTDGARTTLLDVSFGALFDVVEQHPELMTRAAPPLDEIRRLGGAREGVTVQPAGAVTVRFR